MPFLRAALIGRKDAEEVIREPEPVIAPEEVTAVAEDIYPAEDAIDVDNVPEVEKEEGQETEPEPEPELAPEEDTTPEPEPEEPKTQKDYSGANLQYDFTSGERYVDSVSTKTEFDRMLDELSAISGELLEHEAEKFAVKLAGKGDIARKYEAFLGGYITNAAMLLYDKGYSEAAMRRLEQAKSILEARKKLEAEALEVRHRVEEDNDAVDLSDILGLLGD